MQIIIGAVGKLKDGPERTLYARYTERLEATGRRIALGPVKLIELPESRATSAEARKAGGGAAGPDAGVLHRHPGLGDAVAV